MVVVATGSSCCSTEISTSSLPGYSINEVVSFLDGGGCFDVLTVEGGGCDFFFLGGEDFRMLYDNLPVTGISFLRTVISLEVFFTVQYLYTRSTIVYDTK